MIALDDLELRKIDMTGDVDYAFDLYSRTSKDSIIAAQGYWCDEERYSAFIKGISTDDTYMLVENNVAFGCFCLIESDESLMLQRMYVEPAMQGRGIGSAIIDYAIGQARAKGLHLDLEVVRTNEKAYGFYLKRGFHIIYEKPLGYGMRLNIQ